MKLDRIAELMGRITEKVNRPTPSMSRRGNCYDNAMAENFFSILKTECICRQKIAAFRQARVLIGEFTFFYNHERIQLKTGVAPLALHHSA